MSCIVGFIKKQIVAVANNFLVLQQPQQNFLKNHDVFSERYKDLFIKGFSFISKFEYQPFTGIEPSVLSLIPKQRRTRCDRRVSTPDDGWMVIARRMARMYAL